MMQNNNLKNLKTIARHPLEIFSWCKINCVYNGGVTLEEASFGLTSEICEEIVHNYHWALEYIPDRFKTQKMCDEAVSACPYVLEYVPDKFKTQKMCDQALSECPSVLDCIPDKFKTQKMCDEAVSACSYVLEYVPDRFKSQKMCDQAVLLWPRALEYVPDYFIQDRYNMVTGSNPFFEKYRERKNMKRSINKEALATAWHPDRDFIGWCFNEDEKMLVSNLINKRKKGF